MFKYSLNILNYRMQYVIQILIRNVSFSGKPEKLKFSLQCRDVQVYIVLMYLRCTRFTLKMHFLPEPKCITQSKTQRSQINFAKEPNLAPEPRSGQPCECTLYEYV